MFYWRPFREVLLLARLCNYVTAKISPLRFEPTCILSTNTMRVTVLEILVVFIPTYALVKYPKSKTG